MLDDLSFEKIRKYFNNRDDVAFSFLFGSYSRGIATALSDIDIAIYYYSEEKGFIDIEEDAYFTSENEIWADLENLLKREVELIILNRAPATIGFSAIRGIPVVIKDWSLYLSFLEVVAFEAEDFRNLLVEDFVERKGIERRA